MKYSTILSSTDDDVRARVLLLASVSDDAGLSGPWLAEDDQVTRFVLLLAVLYVGLSRTVKFDATPDMLGHLGWPGRLLHRTFCRHAGTWDALRSLVERLSDYPRQTSKFEGNIRLHSRPERWVYRELVAMFGDRNVNPHPPIPGGGKKTADFYVTAIADAVWVEVTMITAQADAFETRVLADYRADFLEKLALYKALGIEPVIIWGDEAASPRALARKLNIIRARLGLPAKPPAPPAWYEEVV